MEPQGDVLIGIIGGTGLYGMEELKDVTKVTLSTPFGSPSDSYVIGTLAGKKIAFLPRHGVGHRYLPSEIPARANIHGFKQLGVKYLISVSAVGSLREDYAPAHVVVPDQIFDATKGVRPATFFGEGIAVHVTFDKPYDSKLSDILEEAVKQSGATVHRGGTYVCMEGPQFSTFAESEEYRRRGHDIIGMTALPEAKLAREAEIAYAAVAMVTDYDCWHYSKSPVNVEDVMAILHQNVKISQDIVRHTISLFGTGFESPAHSSLRNAIVTRRDVMPQIKLTQVELLLKKYITI
jgi:5'-methylthioadenosine phosphorylase